MKVVDPGHTYIMRDIDGTGIQYIQFVKREGDNYPGNTGSRPGILCQEALRVLINRCEYLNNQIPCAETEAIIANLRAAFLAFEVRAARVRGEVIDLPRRRPTRSIWRPRGRNL